MINWKIHPRAVAANVTYLNDEDKTVAFERVDRPTQKTVEDEVEQDDEEWTHTIDGLMVRFLVDGPDDAGEVPVVAVDGYYHLVDADQLKPIKQKLTKSQAWDLCQYYDGPKSMKAYMYDLHDEYDII